MAEPSHSIEQAPERLARVVTLANAVFFVVLFLGFLSSKSLMAVAQAGDSLLDVLLSGLMLWAARVARKPGDAEHPHGHRAAEPIAALITAVAAGVMAVELTVAAVERLLGEASVRLTIVLLLSFVAKGAVKLVVALAALRLFRTSGSPVAGALWVDSRNDVLVASIAVAGYFFTRRGGPAWDAWLSLPMAGWIAWAGWQLASDNVTLLMGGAASDRRHRQLGALVASVPGVQSFHDLVARHHGTHLDVSVHVVLDSTLPLRKAHDIGDAVARTLEQEADVSHVSVHLDVEDDQGQDSRIASGVPS